MGLQQQQQHLQQSPPSSASSSRFPSSVLSCAKPPVRLPAAEGAAEAAAPNAGRPPVLVLHGLMQCSEAWLVGARNGSLPLVLADAGYDVWLGKTACPPN
jgi:hypothetical protein